MNPRLSGMFVRFGPFDGLHRLGQRPRENLIDMAHRHDLDLLFDRSRDVDEILLVLLRNENRRDPAAGSFSLRPPIGSTRPRRVTSPVIATSRRTGIPVSVEIIAVTIPMPADGPSFGTAPSGKWTWMSLRAKIDGFTP